MTGLLTLAPTVTPKRPPGGGLEAILYVAALVLVGMYVAMRGQRANEPQREPRNAAHRFLTRPVRRLQDTPITTSLVVTVTLFAFWLGFVILHTTVHLPPASLLGYHGPTSLMPLSWWGWAHIVAGGLGVVRLFLPDGEAVDLAFHMFTMVVIVGWALAFDVGPSTTGQPAYTFVATVAFAAPFVTRGIERRYGARRPPLGGSSGQQ